jgi:hypothetical protein
MWRIKYKGLTFQEILIMAYMNTLAAMSSASPSEKSLWI